MNLILKPIKTADICNMYEWEYEPPYHIYNLNSDFSLEEALAYFLAPSYAFYALFDQNTDNEFVGFCSFGLDGRVPGGDYYSDVALDIGMGIKPERTGCGLGTQFVYAVTAFAESNFHPPLLRVTVAEFNQRAQRVWQRAGFREASRFLSTNGKRPFIIYTRSVHYFPAKTGRRDMENAEEKRWMAC